MTVQARKSSNSMIREGQLGFGWYLNILKIYLKNLPTYYIPLPAAKIPMPACSV